MNLHVLGSSSRGNCYVLETAAEALVLEAGVRMQDIKRALHFNVRKCVGAFVTHAHNDHAGYVREVASSGVTVLALSNVFASHGLENAPFTKVIQPNKCYKLGNFRVRTLPVQHDVPCLAYVVSHPDMGKLLFATDTVAFPYVVKGLNTILLEANYADDIVEQNIVNGVMPAAMRPRLLNSHLEIEETKAILADTDLSQVNNIILIHLSDNNSDEQRFVREVTQTTGRPVYAANAGQVYDISLKPF